MSERVSPMRCARNVPGSAVLPPLVAAFLMAFSGTPDATADFIRGDADRSGSLTISDAVVQLKFLFDERGDVPCSDAADSNDDGVIDIRDALATLGHLFLRESLPYPATTPGPDPTCDFLGCRDAVVKTPAVVISEIHYNDVAFADREFIELFNRTAVEVSLAGYHFRDGVAFFFPADFVLPPGGRVVLTRDPARHRRVDAPVLGPYDGGLSNSGETISIHDGQCEVETVRYDDFTPWPRSPDGYGPSLERIDPLAPARDFRSWRASTVAHGTPGEPNSTAGTPTRPNILAHEIAPAQPKSTEPVEVSVTLDLGAEAIERVTFRRQAHGVQEAPPLGTVEIFEATLRSNDGDRSVFSATLTPLPSQSIVRVNVDIALRDGRTTLLPPPTDLRPYLLSFVHDRDVPSTLPLMWLFDGTTVDLTPRQATEDAVVFLEPGATAAEVFAGVDVKRSANGRKIRFLRGEEYRGDRTINIIPEEGGGGTGTMAPHMEHLGFHVFRDLGGLAPWADWYRVFEITGPVRSHTQNLVIQQVNERFLAMNGFRGDGDLYKLDKNAFRKQTNPATGSQTLNTLRRELNIRDLERRRRAVLELLDLENVRLYSAISVLIENWDGFHNNLFLYHDLTPTARWVVIPWDLDQVFEPCCWDFPLTFPLTGQPIPGAQYNRSREPGPISRPYHLQPDLDGLYRDTLRAMIATDGPFTVTRIGATIDAIESRLLEDLDLQEEYLGTTRPERRAAIRGAYDAMRRYVERRVVYLREVLAAE